MQHALGQFGQVNLLDGLSLLAFLRRGLEDESTNKENQIMKLYANAYSCELSGFYFSSFEEYEEKLEEKHGACDFEHEIEVIDFDSPLEYHIMQDAEPSNIEELFELIEELEGICSDMPEEVIEWVLSLGCDTEELKEKFENVQWCKRNDFDEYYKEIYEIPDSLINYIDWEAIIRDWDCGGDIYDTGDVIITNANGV